MKTFIRFVIFKGDVLAVFMYGSANRHCPVVGGMMRDCYARIGQHGTCYDGMERRKRATPEQYTPLKKEMESIGYDLEMV